MSPTAGTPGPTPPITLIVGAGMAGLYTAWRLLRAGQQVQIVEQLDRIGGRLQTDHVDLHGVPIHTEEGGMRFMSSQKELLALLSALGLADEIVQFPMGGPQNLYYLRGRRFSVGEAQQDPAIWSRLYHLDDGSKGKQPGAILWNLRNAILRENGQDPSTWVSTPENWTDFRLKYTYRGIPTYRWGFWALLDDYGLTQDCIEMLYQSSGFIAPYDDQINAGSALQLLADFVNPSFLRLRSGYSVLPSKLGAEVQRLGGVIHLKHEVRGYERTPDGRLRVTVRSDGKDDAIVCDRLVLAVTRMALRQLSPLVREFRDSPVFLEDVASVANMPLGKINFYYARNWWTPRFGIADGPCFTDLPLTMFYCFPQADPAGPASITLYMDSYRCNFWTELQALGVPYHSAEFPENPPKTVAASTFVVAAATRQMQQLFGVEDLPAPVLTTYKLWGNPAMGDGDHSWRVGAEDPQVRARLASPFPQVHVCGESYSDDQAWVNGALRSADQMLAAYFGLGTSGEAAAPLEAKTAP